MWAQVDNNTVTKVYPYPKAFSIGDLNYPANTMSVWPEADLNALDIWEVVEDKTNFKEEEWYTNTDVTYTYNSGTGKVDATWGTATAKAIEGLKTDKKRMIDNQCAGLLAPSDWMVVKATETGGTMDSGWKTWRASVRTKCNSMQTQIDNASDVDALATLFTYTEQEDGSVTRPLGEFPEAV